MRENAKWLIFCRFCQSLLQMAAGMLVARYLGPVAYGHLGYAASVAAFAVPVAQLGLNATLVQELGERPGREGEVLGTALGMQMLSGFACLPAVVLFSLAAKPGAWETAAVCGLYGTSLVFQTGELLRFWFHARSRMKISASAALVVGAAVFLYKLVSMAGGKDVRWFAVAHSLESCLLGMVLRVCYRKAGGGKLIFSREMGRMLLSKSRSYIAAGMMTVVFHNTDHVMLTLLAGEAENGYYTAAMTCAGAAGFVYNSILDAARPEILAAGRCSTRELEAALVRLYRLMLGLALLESVAVSALAKPLIHFLYGKDYLPAGTVLRVLVWYLGFSYMGSVRNLWILAEEKHGCLWIINLGMALGNILLNVLLIPIWGAAGAAAASVLTQFAGNFMPGFFWKPLKENQKLLLRAMGRRR